MYVAFLCYKGPALQLRIKVVAPCSTLGAGHFVKITNKGVHLHTTSSNISGPLSSYINSVFRITQHWEFRSTLFTLVKLQSWCTRLQITQLILSQIICCFGWVLLRLLLGFICHFLIFNISKINKRAKLLLLLLCYLQLFVAICNCLCCLVVGCWSQTQGGQINII